MISENGQTGFLKTDRGDGVVTLTIDRPARKNAMTQGMWREMAVLFHGLAGDASVRAVVLRGAGGDFCAGADIGEFETVRGNAQSARRYEAENSAAFAAIRDCPVPTIAAIGGICFGGGFGIATGCDIRIASTEALFSVPAAKLGLAYPVDAMADIVHAVGPQVAKYMTYSAARLDARAALDAGFLLEIVETGGLFARADELAATIAANAPLSIRASKASIRAVLSADPADAVHASTLGDITFESADYAEGRAAFREKRPARFRGC
ncbi:MAG: enoyl-CoA hydratase-related protein [Aquamicrobium sp.]|uniref:enoyl-CoA hydratase-related protein n=1 Tax=Aquamicrobium sp. TaxID=1872579 RepID=UPI00349E8DF4|nr:enoyl-CoA hydratase-related protein [Aquamicrobium sp.]